jgi:hypothetical protein
MMVWMDFASVECVDDVDLHGATGCAPNAPRARVGGSAPERTMLPSLRSDLRHAPGQIDFRTGFSPGFGIPESSNLFMAS